MNIKQLPILSIKKGEFFIAIDALEDTPQENLLKQLFALANEEGNLCAYAFMCFVLSKNPNCTIMVNDQASMLLIFALQYLNGAYEVAAYHVRACFEASLPDSPKNGSMLLYLFDYPERPVSSTEALRVANKILEQDPENAEALKALKDISEWKENPIISPRNQREQLERYILAGKFTEAKQLLHVVSTRELYATLLFIGCEERNLCVYAFTWFLMQEKEVAELHYLAYRIATQAYARNLTGCDAVGIFHLRRAMALEPENEKYVEHFLMMHTPSLGSTLLISDDEAEKIAKQVLDKNRFNVVATNTLKKIGRYDPKYD